MPMERPPEEDCKNDCFKARYTTEYLEKYVDQMKHRGRSLRERIQFGTKVKSIEKADGLWVISCSNNNNDESMLISATKLMIANGQDSKPNMPDIPGKDTFGGVVLHSIDFGESDIIASKTLKNIVVIGGGKSSADMIYELVKAGKTVSWIIRTTGKGAGFFAPLDRKTPYKNVGEAAQTRLMASLQPSILNRDSWWTWFWHTTRIGSSFIRSLFSLVDKSTRTRANYKGRKSTKGFEKLEYDTELFWQNGTGGALHHADFWPLVAENVTVYRDDVEYLSHKTVHLSNGEQFPCDAVLCGTGWSPGLDFFSPELLMELDLPHNPADEPQEITAKWKKMMLEADEKIIQKYLLLANPPPHPHQHILTTPYRLWNGIAPLKDDSIVFLNHITAGNKIFIAEAQAMWAVAYFDRNIAVPSVEEREREIANFVAWSRRRYLSSGELGNFALFEIVTYIDKLLEGIGGTGRWKGWWRDMFEPFLPRDLNRPWRKYLKSRKA